MASHKKTPGVGAPTSFSLTNRASCSCRRGGGPSPRAGKHPRSRPGTAATASRPSAPSPSVRGARSATSISASLRITGTSALSTWWNSSGIFRGTSEGPSQSYGIEATRMTGPRQCASGWRSRRGYGRSGSLVMRPSSIPTSRFGRTSSTGGWRTSCHPTVVICADASAANSPASNTNRNSWPVLSVMRYPCDYDPVPLALSCSIIVIPTLYTPWQG